MVAWDDNWHNYCIKKTIFANSKKYILPISRKAIVQYNERIALGATFLHRLCMQIMQFLIMVQRHILPAIRTDIMALVE